MAVKRIDAVLVDSSNAARLAAFYAKDLGVPLSKESHGSEVHWACDLDGLHFAIHQKSRTPKASRTVSISLQVPDVDKLVKALKKKGTSIDLDPEDRPYGRLAAVEDPDGNVVYLHSAK